MPDATSENNAENREWEDKEWEAREHAARLGAANQPGATAASTKKNDQAAAAAELQAAQIAAYQNQMIQQNNMEQINAAERAVADATIAPLQQQVGKLSKQSSSWKRYYILLFFGALLVDGFSMVFIIIGALIPPIVIISDVVSMIYSAIRFMALREINKGAPKNEEWLRNIRTFGAGTIKLIPVIGAVPLQTVTMITEWQIKKAAMTAVDSKKRETQNQIKQIDKLAA